MIQTEQSLIGSILIDAACLPIVRQILKPEDCELDADSQLFAAACHLADAGKPVDPVTVLQKCREDGADVSEEYCRELLEITPTAAHAEEYARIVADSACRRRLKAAGQAISEGAEDESRSTSEIISTALRSLEAAENGAKGSALVSTNEALNAFYDLKSAQSEGRKSLFVPTGIKMLDRVLGGGLLNQGLYILAARPGIGKTLLALHIAEKAAAHGGVLFVSLEMDESQLTARRLAAESGIAATRLLYSADFSDSEWQKISKAASVVSDHNLQINRRPGATVDDISYMARLVKGLRIVVIDYLGLLQPTERSGSIYERTTANSNALKRLARSLGVPILCLAQLNRQSEQRADHKPTMADLRDSGAIEQDADGVILLHRPRFYDNVQPRPDDVQPLEISVAKNRHAGVGCVVLNTRLSNCTVWE